ncbi:MAG: CxxxxCH/CxxCH domain-containing protein [Isosphaerales bacterium]
MRKLSRTCSNMACHSSLRLQELEGGRQPVRPGHPEIVGRP